MPWIHPLFPYSRSTLSLRFLSLLLSLAALCLFIGAISTFNTTMLNYPKPNDPLHPDTIDIWPSLALTWSVMWSICRILAQRYTVTALSTPLHVTKGLETLRRTGPAIGVLVGDLVTWLVLLSMMTVDLLYAVPFYTRYIDGEGTGLCPSYMRISPLRKILNWYCTNGYVVTAELELAGLVLCAGSILCHFGCFIIGCTEVHRRRLGRQVSSSGVGGGVGRSDVELGGLTAAAAGRSDSPRSVSQSWSRSRDDGVSVYAYREEKRWSSPR